ncbi:MAG: T9SS type A sorting domain-containing protein, partial [Bacteroidales bacterium]|nr:T9SS type A sorting domain-containing protein [Bacteroidales bacterium]
PDYTSPDYLYRHIVANSSFDGGATWNDPHDMNDDFQFIFSECAYPAMAPVVDNTIYFLFQEDSYPGTFEWPGEQSEPCENNMVMMSVPKSFFVGVEENGTVLNFELSQNFPNPARISTQFNLRLDDKSNVTIHVVNVVGQSVKQLNMGSMDAGSHRISLDVSDLTAGIYYCNVYVDGQIATRKLVVQ